MASARSNFTIHLGALADGKQGSFFFGQPKQGTIKREILQNYHIYIYLHFKLGHSMVANDRWKFWSIQPTRHTLPVTNQNTPETRPKPLVISRKGSSPFPTTAVQRGYHPQCWRINLRQVYPEWTNKNISLAHPKKTSQKLYLTM